MRNICRIVAVALLLVMAAAALGVQNSAEFLFVQLADPQLGAATGDKDFLQETSNYEFAVANINRIKPAFVVICGDLINKTGDPVQTAEYRRVTALIDKSIAVYAVPGNHDVGNTPTPEALASYRAQFGADYYSFRQGDLYGIVLDSGIISAPDRVRDEAARQEEWLKSELVKARASNAHHVVVFQHHSWFLEKPTEPAQYFNIPIPQREHYLDILKNAGVRYVFAGHYHRNAYGRDENLEMITSGPVGRPLGADPSGMRIVTVFPDRLEHQYYGFGFIPNSDVVARITPQR